MTWNPTPVERLRYELEHAQEEVEVLTEVVNALRDAMAAESQEGFNTALDEAFALVVDLDEGMFDPQSCTDCAVDTLDIKDGPEYYMVRADIWAAVTETKPAEFLCVGCLEERLGRQLTSEDFNDAPANDPVKESMSGRLRDRMLSPAPRSAV